MMYYILLHCVMCSIADYVFVGVGSSSELYVSAVSVLDDPQQLMEASVLWQEPSNSLSALVVAATIFTDVCMSTDEVLLAAGCGGLPTAGWSTDNSNVQVLNRLNEALRVAEPSEPSSSILGSLMNHSPPDVHHVATCLIVYDIPQAKLLPGAACVNVNTKLKTVSGPVMTSGGGISISLVPSGGGSSNIGGGPTFTDVKDLDNSDDDYDVQIIGVTPAMSPPKMSYDASNISGVGGSGKVSPGRDTAEHLSGSEAGMVIQCVVLPCTAQYVSCFLPTAHGERVFVATAPLSADTRLDHAWQRHGGGAASARDGTTAHLFVFNVVVNSGVVMLEDTPHLSSTVADANNAVIFASLLPTDVGQSDEYDSNSNEQTSTVVVTTLGGSIQVISLADLSVLSVISGDKYKSAIYCCGIDRLCACTANSKLHFFTISKSDAAATDELDDVDALMSVAAVDDVRPNSDTVISSSTSASPSVRSTAARHKLGIAFNFLALVAVIFCCHPNRLHYRPGLVYPFFHLSV